MFSITHIGTSHIKPVCPEAYTITIPDQVVIANPQHKNLDSWRWVNLKPMAFIAVCARNEGEVALGHECRPFMSCDSIDLLKAFGPLMKGNLGKTEALYNYYVRHDRRAPMNVIYPPAVEDFFIGSPDLPREEDIHHELVFIPSGWAIEMISLLRRGVRHVTIDESQKVVVHTVDGASYYHRAVQ